MGFQNFEKKFSGWVWKKGRKFGCTPPPPFLVFFGLQKTCKGADCKRLHLQYLRIANVQSLIKRVQSRSRQSTGIMIKKIEKRLKKICKVENLYLY
jgi:hypothetical protein